MPLLFLKHLLMSFQKSKQTIGFQLKAKSNQIASQCQSVVLIIWETGHYDDKKNGCQDFDHHSKLYNDKI